MKFDIENLTETGNADVISHLFISCFSLVLSFFIQSSSLRFKLILLLKLAAQKNKNTNLQKCTLQIFNVLASVVT